MDDLIEFTLEKFAGKENSHDFYPAACRAGTTADKHHGKESCLGGNDPESEISGGKTGGCQDGENLKDTVSQTAGQGIILPAVQEKTEEQ